MGEGCVCEVEECLLLRNRGIVLGRGDGGGGCGGGGGGGDEALPPPPCPHFILKDQIIPEEKAVIKSPYYFPCWY